MQLAIDVGSVVTKIAYFDRGTFKPALLDVTQGRVGLLPTVFRVLENAIVVGDIHEQAATANPGTIVKGRASKMGSSSADAPAITAPHDRTPRAGRKLISARPSTVYRPHAPLRFICGLPADSSCHV